MPELNIFGESEEEELVEDSGADGTESTEKPDPKSSDKRVRDLQSKADQETARANKAEKRLEAVLKAGAPEPEIKGTPVVGEPPVNDAWVEMARMIVVTQNPKLAQYGLTGADLTGATPQEIATSAATLVARYEKIETQVRNKVLADNGLSPEVGGEQVQTGGSRDFSKMSSEDFTKFQAEVMKGQR